MGSNPFSAIYAQLHPSSTLPISSWNDDIPNSTTARHISASSSDSRGGRVYSISELLNLFEKLNVKKVQTTRPLFLIGRGGFGQVTYSELAEPNADSTGHVLTGIAAVKTLSSLPENSQAVQDTEESTPALSISQAFMEVCIMRNPRLLAHENIINLTGVASVNSAKRKPNSLPFCLVTEYADLGSLDSYLCNHSNQLDWVIKVQLLTDVANGLRALHECDVVHNDVKCGNILLFLAGSPSTQKLSAKIADFGCSVPLAVTNHVEQRAGTLLFAPPEAYREDCPVLPCRDVYAFGLVILHVARETPPFVEIEDGVFEMKQSKEKMRQYAYDILEAACAPPAIMQMASLTLKPLKERPMLHDLFNQGCYPISLKLNRRFSVNTEMQNWFVNILSERPSLTVGELFKQVIPQLLDGSNN